MKKHWYTVLLCLIFLIGLSLILYPTVSNWWNETRSSKVISDYSELVAELDRDEYEQIWEQAVAYNESRVGSANPYLLTPEQKTAYHSTLNVGGNGVMGYIEIPPIGVSLPLYHTVNEDILQVAAGHVEWSDLPVGGEGTHSVLSGHRGLPSAKLFTDLDHLQIGDTFMLRILDGLLTYEVDQILIVEPGNVEDLRQVPGQDLCTLVTCTPYGINTHRLLVRGYRVENTPEAEVVRVTANAVPLDPIIVAAIAAIPMMTVAVITLLAGSKRRAKMKELRKNIKL
jgi:sortase A